MKRILLYLLMICNIGLFAQQDQTLYFMDYVPQSTYINPSFFPKSRVNVGVPGVSSLYLNASNSGFKYNDMIQRRSDDSLTLNMDNLLSRLKDKNYLMSNAQVEILGFGFKVRKNYFHFSVTEKVNSLFVYPKGMIQLFWEGNGGELLGERASLDGLGLDFMHYREYGLNYARIINDQWQVGGRLKYLQGMENIWTKSSELGLTTDATTFDLAVDGHMELYTSGLDYGMDEEYDVDGLISGRNNTGFGIDAGVNYQFNEEFNFSASVLDVGYIRWNERVKNFKSDTIDFTFTGLSLNAIVNDGDTSVDNAIQQMEDSVSGAFKLNESSEGYTNWLWPKIYLAGRYKINEENSAGAIFRTSIVKGRVRPGMVLSYMYQYQRWMTATVNYSMYNRGWTNVGVGVRFNLGPIQLYTATDNIIAVFAPHKVRNAHVHVGLNLTFGRKVKDMDDDGIVDNKDDCPETPGIEKFNGCPDSDNDGIKDSEDYCPTVWGLPEYGGCPDTDGDGIGDLDDDCIDIAGVAEFNGCPDTDGDGISDKEDECPEKVGTAEFGGCPDSDGDGIVDGRDECPDVAGPAEYFGCPVSQLVLVDKKGNQVAVAKRNQDGVFVFEDLPADQHYLFKLEGEDAYMSDDLLILFKENGDETLITAKRSEDVKSFDYEYLPFEDKSVALVAVDEDGNVVAKTFMDSNGQFRFKNLPTDQHYLFKLEGEDVEIPDELKIVIENEDGSFMMALPKNDTGDGFDFEFLPSEKHLLMPLDEAEDGKLVVLEEEEEEVVRKAFENLEFNLGSAVISHNSYKALDELTELLKKNPEWKIKLSGHSDNTGSEIANMSLSKRRAEAVEKYLMKNGIDKERTIVKFYGQNQPIASNDTEEGRQKNRRVEMEILE